MKKIRLLITIILTIILVAGCGKKMPFGLSMEKINSFEHVVMSQEADDENIDIPMDENGFYPVSDNVYVVSDTLNLRLEPNAESEILATVNYGSALSRTGDGTNGWDRIFYEDQVAYVAKEYVTTLIIQQEQSFEFSQAMLNIIDTTKQFYRYQTLCDNVAKLQETFPNRIRVGVLGTTADNRNIMEITIGNPNAKKNITIVASVCGAEYMTSLVCMKQIEYYLTFYDTGNLKGFLYSDLLDNVAIHVIPMLNPDGVTVSEEYLDAIHSEEIQKDLEGWFKRDQSKGGTSLTLTNYLMFFFANARGVDIRNNFNYAWESAGSVTEPSSMGYAGPAAESEAETKAVLHSLAENKTDLLLVYHTTGSAISYNYGQSDSVLAKAREYGEALGNFMNYEVNNDLIAGKGSLEAYANNILGIPALSVHLGNGAAPLSLNEFNAIWNACRDSWAGMQREVFD